VIAGTLRRSHKGPSFMTIVSLNAEDSILPESESIDPKAFRNAMGQFATGITVISIVDIDGSPHGMTVNSFGSLSLEPPLVQWSVRLGSTSFGAFASAKHYAVNVLAADQETVSRSFAASVDRFKSVEWEQGLAGLPLIKGSLAWIECELSQQIDCGDHRILVGRVLRARCFDARPLLFWRGAYLTNAESLRKEEVPESRP
jgi:flavin reductase (DIM6/NTAB) family NADH-FMN oxidoreductase RutF